MSSSAPLANAPLQQWLSYLETLHPTAIDLGLERVSEVARRLGITLPCTRIVVGGTNGKGSTCATLEAIYLAAGYRVGTYTSPHLVKYNERIRLDGELASDEAIVAQFVRIEEARKEITLSYFEFSTLAAMLLFETSRVDVAILEVGLGGRLDAVNIIDADCSIITSVDLDHMQYLGDDREQIGWEKAHIFRRGRPAICSDPMPPKRLVDYAASIGADLWLFGRDFNYSGDQLQWAYGGRNQRRNSLAYPALRGANQLLNASAALAAIEALRSSLAVPQQAVRVGLSRVELPGRMQILPGMPSIVLDVAHNPHAAATLGQSLDAMPSVPATHAVVGMYADKDIEGVVRKLATRIDHWHCVTLQGERGMSAERLAEIIKKVTDSNPQAAGAAWAPMPGEAEYASASTPDSIMLPSNREHDAPGNTPEINDPAAGERSVRSPGVVPSGGPGVKPASRPARSPRRITITCSPDPVSGYREARKAVSDNDRIVVFGSFSTVGPVLQAIEQQQV